MRATEQSYREASLGHIDMAQDMLERKHFVLAAYLSGLSVECMLRAYAYRIDSSFDARHDLRNWCKESRFDAIVPEDRREDIGAALSLVVSHWNNSQRYYSLELLKSEWKSAGLNRGVKGDFVKELTRRLLNAALEIITLGEAQWKNSSKQ